MEFKAILLGLFFNILWVLLTPYYWYISCKTKRTVPPIKNKLLLTSATILAEKIRKKELTSEEVVQTYIDRVKEVNPIINAVVQDRFESALEESRAVDAFLNTTEMPEEELKAKKPLLGVPLTVKECCGLQGMKMTLGSLNWIDRKATVDGDPIQKLKKAGAIPLLVSNTPEYCLSWCTENFVTGRTNNPYDSSRIAGGSSGGEGALVASGASVIGVGSDLGGSIRIPSAFNGVFGHKPTRQIVSIENHMPIQKSDEANALLNVGPICRYAEDLTVMLKVMTGDSENRYGLDDEIDLSKIEVFSMKSVTNPITQISVQWEIQKAIKKAVVHLRDNCRSTINPKKFPELAGGFFVSMPKIALYNLSNLDIDSGIKSRHNFNVWTELCMSVLGRSQYSFPLLYFHLMVSISRKLFKKRFTEFNELGDCIRTNLLSQLGTKGVLLYPNFPIGAPRHGEFWLTSMGLTYTMIFNVLGFPSTAVPMGLDRNGVPIGIQVIAAPNQDKLCIAVAKELSKIGGWVPPS